MPHVSPKAGADVAEVFGERVIRQELEAFGEAFVQLDLERLVVAEAERRVPRVEIAPVDYRRVRRQGLPHRNVVALIAVGIPGAHGDRGSGYGSLVVHPRPERIAEFQGAGRNLVHLLQLVRIQTRALGADVADIQDEILAEFALDVDVPLLRVADPSAVRIPTDRAPDRNRQPRDRAPLFSRRRCSPDPS